MSIPPLPSAPAPAPASTPVVDAALNSFIEPSTKRPPRPAETVAGVKEGEDVPVLEDKPLERAELSAERRTVGGEEDVVMGN